MTLPDEIETLIRARYPLLHLVTNEELRALELLLDIAQRRQKKVWEWSCHTGLVPAGTSIQSQKHRNSPTRDPLVALEQVIDQVEPAIYVFKDFHPFLSRSHFPVVRKLKEIALHLKNSFKTIVLLGPAAELPAELEKEVTVLNLPLPTLTEMSDLLDAILEELKAAKQVQVNLDGGARDRILQAALGLTLSEAENVFAKILVKSQSLEEDAVAEVFTQKRQIVRKSGLLEYCAAEESFEHVGGLSALKDWLIKRSVAFGNQARDFGLPAPRGILLLGVQGCGKSLCAKAVSNLWQLPLLRFDMGRMFGSLVGSSEENVRRAIGIAESVAPAVLWVDEIDKAFAGSQSSGGTDGGTGARVFGTLLTWLSEKSAPVFVVATANDISQLPPELLRKGRFDEIFFVDLPSPEERAEVFRIHLARRGRDVAQFDLGPLVEGSHGLSGAEIEQAIVSALFDAFHEQRELETDHVRAALAETVPLSRTMDEQIGELRAWADGRARNASVPRGANGIVSPESWVRETGG